MGREKRLEPVLKMAEAKVDEAARALGYLNQKIAQEEATRALLKNYEGEYLQLMRGGDQAGRRMDVQAVMRYQLFIQRLEAAQIQQNEQLHLLQQQKAQVTEHWIKTRARAQAVSSAMDSIRREEAVQSNRQEQKLFDELNTMRIARMR
ncbi:flagellar FliJ family protein [Marinospirillum alkaliphilum]|uniref:Flagellar FliJ protein n=1 Tax=Marinospirillum alkaliphilum DSM 21637 TaxID=1122209 RepID=A0A1K1VBX4_9GAMM|nr:flagellar FliJ family protein [Marinospirillum alkaliphilum]SFX22227.1 FliJ protein [Marinospirillum alkaliphilum DSM 21637]